MTWLKAVALAISPALSWLALCYIAFKPSTIVKVASNLFLQFQLT
jgi:hypothetical protein